MTVRQAYLDAAAVAVELLADPAVAAAWDRPSALEKLTVAGLAGHLARQITTVPEELDHAIDEFRPPVTLLDHFGRSHWVGADLDSEPSVAIRRRSEQAAEDGIEPLLAVTRSTLERLRERLPAEPAEAVVHRASGWSLTLDDYLVTRLLELAVHCDDLACSVGVETPAMPAAVIDPVLDLLVRLSARRHGPVAVLRALSRSERAPATISAL